MTNEQIVSEIRNGFSVTDNMQLLYEKNLPLIRILIKPYAAYETMEDLLQEAYFGLWEAVHHYETAENVLFMTYARFWIKQAVVRYLEKCGSTVRYPSHTRQRMIRYKKTVERLEQEQGRTPTNGEIAAMMGLELAAVLEIKSYTQGVASLDSPLAVDDDLTLADTVQADSNTENDVIDKYMMNTLKMSCGALWRITRMNERTGQ